MVKKRCSPDNSRQLLLASQLQVIKGNPAKRLYDRLGFEVVGEDDQHFHMRRAPRAPLETKAE
jgi:ribosomal protein S18 acetylase RimI-like enzyme